MLSYWSTSVLWITEKVCDFTVVYCKCFKFSMFQKSMPYKKRETKNVNVTFTLNVHLCNGYVDCFENVHSSWNTYALKHVDVINVSIVTFVRDWDHFIFCLSFCLIHFNVSWKFTNNCLSTDIICLVIIPVMSWNLLWKSSFLQLSCFLGTLVCPISDYNMC